MNEFSLYQKNGLCFHGGLFSEEAAIERIRSDPAFILKIKDPNENMKWAALEIDPTLIKFYDHPSEEMCLYAIEDDLANLNIVFQTKTIIWESLKMSARAIYYIKNQTDEMIDFALEQDPDTIGLVNCPTEDQIYKVFDKITKYQCAKRCYGQTKNEVVKTFLRIKFGV